MGKMKDIVSDICELHSRGFKPITIAALLRQPVEIVEETIYDYQREYEEAFRSQVESEASL